MGSTGALASILNAKEGACDSVISPYRTGRSRTSSLHTFFALFSPSSQSHPICWCSSPQHRLGDLTGVEARGNIVGRKFHASAVQTPDFSTLIPMHVACMDRGSDKSGSDSIPRWADLEMAAWLPALSLRGGRPEVSPTSTLEAWRLHTRNLQLLCRSRAYLCAACTHAAKASFFPCFVASSTSILMVSACRGGWRH
jgi:hypothetical protein